MTASELDQELDELYGAPLERFVAARTELAARLRAKGDTAGATRIKALPKPSVSAWVVNQLHRKRPELLEALFDASGDMREAQRDALAGHGGESLRDATHAQRDAISKLTAAARALLEASEHAATDTTLDRVASTLQALGTSGWPEDGAGRLSKDLDPPGFDALTGLLTGAPAPSREKRASRAAEPEEEKEERAEERRRREQRAEAEAALAQAKSGVKAAQRDAEKAEATRERAAERAETSRRRAEEAEREAGEALDRAKTAERAADEAEKEAERATREIARAEAEVVAAEKALAKLQ